MKGSKLQRVAGAAFLACLVGCLALALPAAQAGKKKPKHVTKTKQYTSGNLSLTAPDPNPGADPGDTVANAVRVSVSVGKIPNRAKVRDVNVSLRVTAAAARDVEAYLATPRGLIELTTDNPVASADNDYGSGAPDCSGAPTVFDSQAPTSITTGTAPFVGQFQPEESLGQLNGMRGTKAKQKWSLLLFDDDPGGAVTLNCFKLHIRYRT